MPQVSACPLPALSLLHDYVGPEDFLDCYSVASDMPARQAAEIITTFPGWARLLVAMRNLLVSPLGLKGDGPASSDKIGLFPVDRESAHEVIAGFNDKHLDFRVSALQLEGRVYLATWAHRHNLAGRLYLATIMPFHILIARNALRRVARHQPLANSEMSA